jgi:tetratricopeptide (TPR) repeat protein
LEAAGLGGWSGVHPHLAAVPLIGGPRLWWLGGQRDQTRLHEGRAEELVRGRRTAAAARVIATIARTSSIAGDRKQGMALASQALAMAEELDLDDVRAHALTTTGMCRRAMGDASGIDDLERALQLAIDTNWPEASSIANNLAVDAMLSLDPRRARDRWDEARRLAERFGDAAGLRWMRGQQIFLDLIFGHWDVASSAADAFIAESESGSRHYIEPHVRSERARIRVARGDREGALEDHRRAIALVQEGQDPQQVLQAYGAAVLTLEQYGLTDEARRLANELVPLAHTSPDDAVLTMSIDFLFSRLALEYEQELREALGRAPLPELLELAFACLDRDFVRAADLWEAAGSPTWEARLRLRAAEELVEKGEVAEAREQAEKAIAFYRSVSATAYIERAEALLAGRHSP